MTENKLPSWGPSDGDMEDFDAAFHAKLPRGEQYRDPIITQAKDIETSPHFKGILEPVTDKAGRQEVWKELMWWPSRFLHAIGSSKISDSTIWIDTFPNIRVVAVVADKSPVLGSGPGPCLVVEYEGKCDVALSVICQILSKDHPFKQIAVDGILWNELCKYVKPTAMPLILNKWWRKPQMTGGRIKFTGKVEHKHNPILTRPIQPADFLTIAPWLAGDWGVTVEEAGQFLNRAMERSLPTCVSYVKEAAGPKLVGWGMVYPCGSVGAFYVRPEYKVDGRFCRETEIFNDLIHQASSKDSVAYVYTVLKDGPSGREPDQLETLIRKMRFKRLINGLHVVPI